MTTQTAAPIAALRAVTRRFGAQTALAGVDLQLAAGEVTALLGPNGAGKTTLAGVLTGRLKADAGTVTLFDEHPRAPHARARMGIMLQAAGLPESLTVAETVSLQASYFRRSPPLAETLARAGLGDLARRRNDKLSGGQKRRVQFAMAIAGKPDFLVLDEPTTGLDAEARRGLWAVVRDAAREGAGVLLTTHLMDEAEALADRIVVIANGRIRADGAPGAIRAATAGTTIIARTKLEAAALSALPHVTRARQNGGESVILTNHPRETLQAMFAADPNLTDFRVEAASLEDALADIVAKSQTERTA